MSILNKRITPTVLDKMPNKPTLCTYRKRKYAEKVLTKNDTKERSLISHSEFIPIDDTYRINVPIINDNSIIKSAVNSKMVLREAFKILKRPRIFCCYNKSLVNKNKKRNDANIHNRLLSYENSLKLNKSPNIDTQRRIIHLRPLKK